MKYLLLNHTNKFEIAGNVISILAPLNFEEQSFYQVDIESTDLAGASIVVSITITIVDVYDVPDHVFFSTAPENVAINTTVIVHDEDANDNHTFKTVGRSQYFRVDHHGVVYTSVLLDFEHLSQLILNVVVTDNGNLNKIESIVIQLIDVYDVPDHVFFSTAPENVAINTTVIVHDEDANDNHTFKTVGRSQYFRVDHHGVVYTSVLLDFEHLSQLILNVVVTDNGNLNKIESIVIQLIDVNEAPYGIILSDYVVAENQPAGVSVATITVEDQDYNETFSCQLTQPLPSYFEVTHN